MPKQTRKTRDSRFGEILKDARVKSGRVPRRYFIGKYGIAD